MYAFRRPFSPGLSRRMGVQAVSDPKDFRKRLDALNREPLPPAKERSEADVEGIRKKIRRMRHEEKETQPKALLYSRDLPRTAPAQERPKRWSIGPPVSLEESSAGESIEVEGGGSAYVIRTPLDARPEEWSELVRQFPIVLGTRGAPLRSRILASCGLETVVPEDFIFLDLETTGLGSTPVFLIGTMAWEDGDLVVSQYFARDYSEERAIISLFNENAAGRRLLVSFNGKTFDVPYLRVRAAATGLPFSEDFAHFDLLHECRRIWRNALPNCKLQTLETHVCGRVRHADIPGSEIPDAYHEFVRTGNAVDIVDILEHNLLDLVTLADLAVRLPP
jgi:uncharacterized protein YprB with RNaseH-like and TPR domain